MIDKRRAKFITLEGLEGSGKSSVISFLEKYLRNKNYKVIVFREPGSTKIGEKIRRILLDKNNTEISHHTELLLYLAARTQLIEEKLNEAFKRYDFVICDRFFDSTLVYQGYALGLGKIVNKSVELFSLGLKPDLTIILDVSVRRSLNRLKTKDRIESKSLRFHQLLRKGYRQLADRYPRRVKLVCADKDLDSSCQSVKELVNNFLCRIRQTK